MTTITIKYSKWLISSLMLVASLGIGCGDDDGTTGGTDGSVRSDAGSQKTGAIAVTQSVFNDGETTAYSTVLSASFGGTGLSGIGETSTCNKTTTGACTTTVCQIPVLDGGVDAGTIDAGTIDAGQITLPNAGVISMTGGLSTAMISPGSNGGYSPALGFAKLWNGNETLTFQAAGADVPAFTQTIKAPADISILTPEPSGGSLTVAQSSNLIITWTPLSSDTRVLVTISQASPTQLVDADCEFDGNAGTGTIQSSVLGTFTDQVAGLIQVRAGTSAQVTAGAYRITITGTSNVNTAEVNFD